MYVLLVTSGPLSLTRVMSSCDYLFFKTLIICITFESRSLPEGSNDNSLLRYSDATVVGGITML